MASIRNGDTLPELTLTTHDGQEIQLGKFRGERPLVLFFFPRAGTPVCTKEACSFRDAFESFQEAGATVIGISGDTPDRLEAFAKKHDLPYLLASDAEGVARRTLGVPKSMGFMPGRVTYVADADGVVRHIFNSQLDGERHVREALETLRSMAT